MFVENQMNFSLFTHSILSNLPLWTFSAMSQVQAYQLSLDKVPLIALPDLGSRFAANLM